MSGDSNEFASEEEVDVLSLIATESDEVEDEGEVDDTIPEDYDAVVEALKKEREIKSKRNKSLRKAKEAQHRTQSEYDTLLQRLEAIENRPTPQPDNRAEQLEQEAQAWRDRVEDDPKEAVGYVDHRMTSFEDRMVRFLDEKFGGIDQKIADWQGQTNPDRREYGEQMDALRRNPNFADLDDDTLLRVAKGLSAAKVKNPRGSVGGNRGGGGEGKAPKITKEDLAKMGF